MDIPAWITNAVEHYLALFRLNDWRVRVMQAVLDGDENSHVMGKADTDAQYFNATITFDETLTTDQLHIVCHEMLHLVLAEMRDLVGMIIAATPFRQQVHFWRLYGWAEERLIQKIKNIVSELDTYEVKDE